MLELRILQNKENFTKRDGTVVVDLVRRAVSFLGLRSGAGKAYYADEEVAVRPDLISQYFYRTSNQVDLLLKYNGYSNPFAIDIDDFFRIPSAEVLNQFGTKPNLTDLGLPRKKETIVQLKPKSKKDQTRIDFLLKKQNAAPPVPPNVAVEDGVKVANGKIVFGADVTNVKKQDCPDPVSRTRLKESLIQTKLSA